MINVEVRQKEFPKLKTQEEVLKNISFVIPKGDFLGIYGPNACGKTTLLKIIGKLDKNFDGKIDYKENIKTGFVFQNYKESLFPWINNIENISYFFYLKGISKGKRYAKVFSFLKKYNLEIDLKAYPYQQSAGQQQLVSLLRAMIYTPKLLIMDEPFGSLDQRMRLKMCKIIQEYWKEYKPSILFVSHDLDETLLLSENVLIMRKIDGLRKNSILTTFTINFKRPRKITLVESLSFFDLKSKILSLIREDIQNEQKN